jgi:hypothetical protein
MSVSARSVAHLDAVLRLLLLCQSSHSARLDMCVCVVLSSLGQATSIPGCCEELEIFVARSSDFLRGGHARNAVAVLEVITPPVVAWLVEQGSPDDLDDPADKASLQEFVALLENAWQAALENAKLVPSAPGTAPTNVAEKTTLTRTSGAEKAAKAKAGPRPPYTTLSTAEMAGAAQLLQQGMNKLKATQGAIFSDAVRLVNRRMKTAMASAPAAAAAASSSPAAAADSAAAAPVAGSKRKAVELGESGEASAEAPVAATAEALEPTAAPASSAAAAAAVSGGDDGDVVPAPSAAKQAAAAAVEGKPTPAKKAKK